MPRQRARHRDRGPLARRQSTHGPADVEVVAEVAHCAAGPSPFLAPANQAEPAGFVAVTQRQVVDCVKRRDETEVLMDETQPGGIRRGGVTECQRPIDDGDLATGIRLVETGQYFDQRRLAAAVLTDQGTYLTGLDVDVDVHQGALPRERLRQPSHAEHGSSHHRTPRLRATEGTALFLELLL